MQKFRITALASTSAIPAQVELGNSLVVGHVDGERTPDPRVFWKGNSIEFARYSQDGQMPQGVVPTVVVVFDGEGAVTFTPGGEIRYRGEVLTVHPSGGVVDFDRERLVPVL